MKNMGLIIHFDNDMHFDMGLNMVYQNVKTGTLVTSVVEKIE